MKKLNDAEFLQWELEMGIGFHNPGFIELANATARQLQDLDYKTVLDYGCGTGVYAAAFAEQGKDVTACDISAAHIEYIKQNAPQLKISKKPITADLLAWIEVAEHMTDKEIDKLLKAIEPRYILFSSTSQKTDQDEAWGHINIKEQDEWIRLLGTYGYQLKKHLAAPTQWAKLFEKTEPTP